MIAIFRLLQNSFFPLPVTAPTIAPAPPNKAPPTIALPTPLFAIVSALGFFRKQQDQDSYADEFDYDYAQRTRKTRIWRILSMVTAVITLVVFLLTQNMTLPMAFFDKWTIPLALLLVIQGVFALLTRREKIQPEDDDIETYNI